MQLLKLGYKRHCDFHLALLDHLLWESQFPHQEYTQEALRQGIKPFENIQQEIEASWQCPTRNWALLAMASNWHLLPVATWVRHLGNKSTSLSSFRWLWTSQHHEYNLRKKKKLSQKTAQLLPNYLPTETLSY